MEDARGKSGRHPGRHLEVEASGLGNAASVRQRLATTLLAHTHAAASTCTERPIRPYGIDAFHGAHYRKAPTLRKSFPETAVEHGIAGSFSQ